MASIQVRATARYIPIPGVEQEAATLAVPQMDRLGERIVGNAKRRCPVRTGALRESIGHRTTLGTNKVVLTVFANRPYARFVHEGTRPHIIRPRRAKALSFFWPKAGRQVFFAHVNHPGTRANAFLRDAVDEELGRT